MELGYGWERNGPWGKKRPRRKEIKEEKEDLSHVLVT